MQLLSTVLQSAYHIYLIDMDHLYLAYKELPQWIITQKQIIFQTHKHNKSLVDTFHNFISKYCDKIDHLIIQIQKEGIKAKKQNKRMLAEVLEIMANKQKDNLREWLGIKTIIKHFTNTEQNLERLETIFHSLDQNIEFYIKIKVRLEEILNIEETEKLKHAPLNKINLQRQEFYKKKKHSDYSPNYSRRKISEFSSIYDQLNKPKDNSTRETGRIKTNMINKTQLSPYKSIRYTELGSKTDKIEDPQHKHKRYLYYNYDSEPVNETFRNYGCRDYPRYSEYKEKELLYKMQLHKNMHEDLNIKTTRSKEKSVTPKKQKFYEPSQTTTKKKAKRYQYLTEDDDIPLYYEADYAKNQNFQKQQQKLYPPALDKIPKLFPNDSLESNNINDSLGKQLQQELPVLIQNKKQPMIKKENEGQQSSLQNILAMSLTDSKRWSMGDREEEDSLDNIRQTGKFNYMGVEQQQTGNNPQKIRESFEDSLDPKDDIRISFGK